ncbi:MAG: ecdysteroid 22-kinase family protein [Acidimicrobiales bacterium]|nr:ecdysteroid 22-kinase family protein [Acidimicrobiales bacterium]
MTIDSPPVCDAPEDLTPEWVTAALATRDITTPVTGVRFERVGTGQMGTSYRLWLDYADPASAEAEGAPATLVAKMAAGDPASRDIIAEGYRNEVGFYRELAGTLAVRTPRCWYATIADDWKCFVLLLEDLAPSVPGDQVRGVTVDEARDAVVNLAGLHGPRWKDDSLLQIEWLKRHEREGAEFYAQVLDGAIPTFLERFEARMGPDDPATLREVPAHLADWLLTRPERFSVIHGDYRPDNLMFPAHGAGVSAVDWQTLALGLPGRDIGYFLATSLDVADRRAHERELVAAYHEALAAHGVTDHDLDECFDDYRLGVVQGPMITVLGAVYATDPNDASDAMFTAMITRSLAAIRDLRPYELL